MLLEVDECIEEEELLAFLEERGEKEPRHHQIWLDLSKYTCTSKECIDSFHFEKGDLHRLANALNIPLEVLAKQNTIASQIEALCICLRRLCYPNRYCNLVPQFGRSETKLSYILTLQ